MGIFVHQVFTLILGFWWKRKGGGFKGLVQKIHHYKGFLRLIATGTLLNLVKGKGFKETVEASDISILLKVLREELSLGKKTYPGIKRSLYWVLEKLAKQGIVDPLIEAGTIAVLFEVVQKNPTPSDLSLFALFEILEYGGVEQFVSTIGTKVLFEKLDSPSFWESALSRSLLSVLARKGEHQTVVPVLLDYSKADNWAKLEHSVGCLSRILEETYERLEEKQILDIIASCIVALQNGDTDTRYVGISGLEFASSEPALRDKISGGTVTLVIKSLKDEDPDIRYYAAKTLGNLKERSAVEELKLLLDDLEPVEGARYTKLRRLARSVSDGAREALEKIKGRDSQDE